MGVLFCRKMVEIHSAFSQSITGRMSVCLWVLPYHTSNAGSQVKVRFRWRLAELCSALLEDYWTSLDLFVIASFITCKAVRLLGSENTV